MRRISVLSPQWRITVPFLVPAIFKTEYAPVMELVDMRDLGAVPLVESFCKNSGEVSAAHICGYDEIGKHAGFRCCHLSEEFPIN